MTTEPCVTRVIGCVSCGKPALLVGDEAPKAFPACFWCLAERRPGASKLFLDEVRAAERERVLATVEAKMGEGWKHCSAGYVLDELRVVIRRIRSGEL